MLVCKACDEPFVPMSANQYSSKPNMNWVNSYGQAKYCSDGCRYFVKNQKNRMRRDFAYRVYRFMERETPNALKRIINEMEKSSV